MDTTNEEYREFISNMFDALTVVKHSWNDNYENRAVVFMPASVSVDLSFFRDYASAEIEFL